jgi:hypothetical protein
MRKLMLAGAIGLLPLLGVATAGTAAASVAGGMTALDRLASEHSNVEEARYRRCHRVCVRRNYRGYCVRSVLRCYRPVRRYYRW